MRIVLVAVVLAIDGLVPDALPPRNPDLHGGAPGVAGTVPALCKHCGRPATPSRARNRDYRCKRCINASPAGQARLARYNGSSARKAVNKRHNARRIFLGRVYHSTVGGIAEARRINAHIKERRLEFVERQQDREKAEGATAR